MEKVKANHLASGDTVTLNTSGDQIVKSIEPAEKGCLKIHFQSGLYKIYPRQQYVAVKKLGSDYK